MKMPRRPFQIIFGIDQTGATQGPSKSRAKPLPSAVLTKKGRQWRLRLHSLPSLTRENLQEAAGDLSLASALIAVDSVLGLPAEVWPQNTSSLKSLFKKASLRKTYGFDSAALFFGEIWSGKSPPKRQVERLAKANSVFTSRPFQKNIQTGSFRVWKDLGPHTTWFRLWPHDVFDSTFRPPYIFEVYPSLLWKSLFDSSQRKPSQLKSLIQKRFPEISISPEDQHRFIQPDYADAVVAALGAFRFFVTQNNFYPPKDRFKKYQMKREGWILGLEPFLEGDALL